MTDVQRSPCLGQEAAQVRSSGRLQAKYQRRFSMPSRKDELERIAPGKCDDQTPLKDYSHLKPRRLINNFIKERNTYNNPDKIDLYDEFSDDDFIDDGEFEADSSTSTPKEGSVNTSNTSSSSESSSEDRAVLANRHVLRRTRSQRRTSSLSSKVQGGRGGTESGSEEEELAKPLKRRRQSLPSAWSSGSEATSGEEEEKVSRTRKRCPKLSVESDGSSDDEEALDAATELRDDKETELNNQSADAFKGEADKAYFRKDVPEDSDSDRDFIATSSSSDDVLSEVSDERESSDPDKPSHEELICNYRQKGRRRTQRRVSQKQRVQEVSESESSGSPEGSDDDSSQSGLELETAAGEVNRCPSKRAERLRRKKAEWHTEVLGTYKEKRNKKASKKKEEKLNGMGKDDSIPQ